MISLSRRGFFAGFATAAATLALGLRPARAADFKVTFYNAFAPLSFETDSHEITGVLPDMVTEILGHRMGLPVSLQGLPWARAQALVQDGSADAFCTNPTPARLDYAVFTNTAAITTKTELFYLADNPRKAQIEAIKTVDQLKGFTQGDYVGNGFAEATFKGLNIDYTPTLDAVFRKIAVGRLDLFVGNDLVAKSVLKQAGLGDKIKSFPVDIGQPSHFHIGIRKSYADADALVAKADAAIAAAEADGSLKKIVAKYTI